MRRIRFQGVEYVLVGDLETGGAIALEEDYQHGRLSYAHLGDDGVIRRFHNTIGTASDIEDLGECDPELADDHWCGLFGPTWPV